MSEQRGFDAQLKSVEAALSALAPRQPQLDRDQIMFAAGRAAGAARPTAPTRTGWGWPAATAAMLLLSLAMTAMWLGERHVNRMAATRPPAVESDRMPPPGRQPRDEDALQTEEERPEVERVIAHAMSPSALAPIEGSYLSLRRVVLADGADVVPAPAPSRSSSAGLGPAGVWRDGLGEI